MWCKSLTLEKKNIYRERERERSRERERNWYGFCAVFCLKTVIVFARFGLESGIVFKGATVVYEYIYGLVPNK